MYGSHIPVLVRALEITDGDVLELGSGYSSTALLKMLCLAKDRKFQSYENNINWVYRMEGDTLYIRGFDEAPIEKHWSVAFIDHDPAERRVVDVKRLINYADYIIIHDSEPEEEKRYHYSEIYPLFKYRYDYKKFKVHTTVLSNKKPFIF